MAQSNAFDNFLGRWNAAADPFDRAAIFAGIWKSDGISSELFSHVVGQMILSGIPEIDIDTAIKKWSESNLTSDQVRSIILIAEAHPTTMRQSIRYLADARSLRTLVMARTEQTALDKVRRIAILINANLAGHNDFHTASQELYRTRPPATIEGMEDVTDGRTDNDIRIYNLLNGIKEKIQITGGAPSYINTTREVMRRPPPKVEGGLATA